MRVHARFKQSVTLSDGSSLRDAIGEMDPVTGILWLDVQQVGTRKVPPGLWIHLGSLCTGRKLPEVQVVAPKGKKAEAAA